jgi:hypothetical protein
MSKINLDAVRLAASRAHRARTHAEAAMEDFRTALQALDAAIASLGDYKVQPMMPIAYDSLGRPVYPKPSGTEISADKPGGGADGLGSATGNGGGVVDEASQGT